MKITVYSTATCPYCIHLKNWLDQKSVEYDLYDVNTNPIAAQNMMRLAEQDVVPFTTIEFDNGDIEKIVGFDKDKFEKAFKK